MFYLRVVASVVCILSFVGCGRDETPCLSWVQIGASYRVEVLGAFSVLTQEGEPRAVPPYASYGAEPTCGQFLGDHIEGTFTFTATDLITSETGGCALVRASAPIPGTILEELHDTSTVATTFRRSAKIETDSGCVGTYTIGIVRVLDTFISTEGGALSDHMVFREFLPERGDPECLDWPDLGYPCGDNWYVRIWDQSNTRISRDEGELDVEP